MALKQRIGLIAAALWFTLGSPASAGGVQTVSLQPALAAPERVSIFSGQRVPRLASLRYDAVNGRVGPSLDYPIAWRYQRQGLPVVVVRESTDWRKILDPLGDEVWVHKRMLASRQTAMIRTDGPLCRRAKDSCRKVAALAAGVVVEVESCTEDWCETYVDDRRGWTARRNLWGAEFIETDD